VRLDVGFDRLFTPRHAVFAHNERIHDFAGNFAAGEGQVRLAALHDAQYMRIPRRTGNCVGLSDCREECLRNVVARRVLEREIVARLAVLLQPAVNEELRHGKFLPDDRLSFH
jgi:hypothetical protein